MKKVFYAVLVWMLSYGVVLAQGTGGSTQGGGSGTGGSVKGGSTTFTDPLGVGGISGLFDRIINDLLLLAGPIAVIMIVYAGYLFVTAADNQEQVKKAKATVKYAVIGIAVLVLSKALIYVTCDFLGVKCTP